MTFLYTLGGWRGPGRLVKHLDLAWDGDFGAHGWLGYPPLKPVRLADVWEEGVPRVSKMVDI